MSDFGATFWRTVSLFLLIALVGVYVLYEWYDEGLYTDLEERDAIITEARQQVRQLESEREVWRSAQAAFDTRIDTLEAQCEAETRRLERDKEALAQEIVAWKGALEEVKAQDAAMLAEERQCTADALEEKDEVAAALADLRQRYEVASDLNLSLQAKLDKLNQVIAQTIAEHQAQIAELERHLNERIELARTTPMDAELLRTAESFGIAPAADSKPADPAALVAELSKVQGQLQSVTQALEETRAAGDDSRLSAARAELAAAQARIEDLEAGLQEARGTTVEAVAALDAANDRGAMLEAELEDVRAEVDRLTAALQTVREGGVADVPLGVASELDSRLADAQARIAVLEGELEAARTEAAAAEQALAKLRTRQATLAELGGCHTEQGIALRLDETRLRFAPGQAELPTADRPDLERIAKLLREQQDLRVRIEGHTDSVGSEALNLELSQRRAEAVRLAFVERGVSAERIQAEGLGAARPIADNATSTGRGRNRRVEVYIEE